MKKRDLNMKSYLFLALLNVSLPLFAVQGPKSAEAFQMTNQYTKEMLGESQAMSGKVVDKIDVANYTYVQFAHGKGQLWLATSKIDVKKGDLISFESAQSMHNFHSKSLNRTFDEIYFVTELSVKR